MSEQPSLGFSISPGSLASGLLLLAIGFFLLYRAGQISVLLCSRLEDGQVDCRVQHQLFGLIPVAPASTPIQDVLTAQVVEDCAVECRYLFTLQTMHQVMPLEAFTSPIARYPRTLAFELNNFLEHPQGTTFRGREPIQPGIWPPILFLLTGAVILAFGLSAPNRAGSEPTPGRL